VCCIESVEEARQAVAEGVDAIGLVSAMPSGPGVILESTIAEIAATVPSRVSTFLLTSLVEADAIAAQYERCGTTTIQLCDRLSTGALERLRERIPEAALVQVIHVTGPEALDEAISAAPYVDALLLDSGDPRRSTKELGGTGRVHDWAISAEIRHAVPAPIFLAGGLHAGNVRAAIDQVGPWGVDVCSGVRTAGRLDLERLRSFLAALGRTPVPAIDLRH
jgi:phosphoribosylanthranilate isomerase